MKAKKRFGQNFLKDDSVLNKISSLIDATENDLVIEIGPGKGALTKKIKCKNLLCIEIDQDMKEYLNKYNVIYDDVLNVDIKSLLKNYKYNKLYIVGNLPYYITSPIIEHLINSNTNIDSMVFMVQKEVAERFSSSSGNKSYGYMSLFIQHYYNVNTEFGVSKYSFDPVPKVDSAVIKLTKKDVINVDEGYFDFLKKCFRLKRKTLKNNLSSEEYELIKDLIKPTTRAEELSEKEFIKLYNAIKNKD